MSRYELKQWHNKTDEETTIEEFEGDIEQYFNEHLKRIKEDGKYQVVTSNRSNAGFFIEITDGKFDTVKCTAKLLEKAV